MRHAPSPAMLLLLLLLGIELATVTCSCRGLKPDVAAAAAVAPKHGGDGLWVARAPPRTAPGVGGVGARAAQGESKRLVPQGPNPLHN
ncbi:unnamed protein product [Urochloa humidicola]